MQSPGSGKHVPPPLDAISTWPGKGQPPPGPSDWQELRPVILHLYETDDRPLKEVKQILQDRYGFKASERMFKSRLTAWNSHKNAKKDDWSALAILLDNRKSSGKRSTSFTVRGRGKTERELKKYIKSIGSSEDDFLADALARITHVPSYIRSFTPERDASRSASPNKSSSPDPTPFKERNTVVSATSNHSSRANRFLHLSPLASHDSFEPFSEFSSLRRSPAFQPHDPQFEHFWTPQDSDMSTQPEISMASYKSPATTATEYDTPATANPPSEPCDQLQRDLELMGRQMTDPAPLRTRSGSTNISSWILVYQGNDSQDPETDEYVCSRCRRPGSEHFASIDSFTPVQDPQPRNILHDSPVTTLRLPVSTKAYDPAPRWLAHCFSSCINLTRGNRELFDRSMRGAGAEFRDMILHSDPLLLTAANLMVIILQQHDQGEIVAEVMNSPLDVIEEMLAEDHPIRVTITFLAFSASLCLDQIDITSSKLGMIYETFVQTHGTAHPYAITSHYNYGWMLKYEEHFAQAEIELSNTYTTACKVFGRLHMQSIGCLGALTGAKIGLGKTAEALRGLRLVINDAGDTLGVSHPYVMDGKRRIAELLKNVDATSASVSEHDKKQALDEAESLYHNVLVGRVRMLGRRHRFTRGAREDYKQILKQRHRWTASDGSLTAQAREATSLFATNDDDWVRVGVSERPSSQFEDEADDMQGEELEPTAAASPTSSNEHEAY